jgi:hypothetical protein
VAEQISFGEDGTAIISEIIRAVKRVNAINQKPEKFWMKYVFGNMVLVASEVAIYLSNMDALKGIIAISAILSAHIYYLYFAQPFLVQSLRRTIPIIILDDLNKI